MTLHRELKTSFGKISDLYDKVRPDYPRELINKVITISKIKPKSQILEIGTGSGIGTLPFAKKGFKIIGCDISSELISIAKLKLRHFPNVTFEVSSFEKMRLTNESFDLIFSAQAFHWIDPKVGYSKIHRLLSEKGHIALLSNYEIAKTHIQKEIDKLFEKHCPKYPGRIYVNLDLQEKKLQLPKLFDQYKKLKFQRNLSYPIEKYLGLLQSFSWVLALNPKQHDLFFSDVISLLGSRKRILVPVESVLLIARKKPS